VKILLSGVVGSTAYGLARPGSDIDRLGVFAARTEAFLGLANPQESIVETNPDITMHEARKYCQLALKCNPTVMELLWLDEYETTTPLGEALIGIREAFLSAAYVRNAYLGYATQQFKKLESRADGTFGPDLAKRTAKHARHMNRLLIQGLELWRTGRLSIRLQHPDIVMSFGSMVAMGNIAHAKELLGKYEYVFDNAPCVLPEKPDTEKVEDWLQTVRATFYVPRETSTEE
jgi:predicted nucleotidyltransferase